LGHEHPQLHVLGYQGNHGRGYAIRTGVIRAQGNIVVTTEIDSSWGEDIVHRIVEEFRKRPDADMVIASTHLPGGGYRNVPLTRVLLSTLGNWIIRSGLTYQVTMNTGMTRGYRRDRFLTLPLDENGKELHLEIVNKALAFGYRIYEIPAILEWQNHRLFMQAGMTRRSSSNVHKVIQTHVLFSLLAAPFRYLYPVSALLGLVSTGLLIWAFCNLFTPEPSIFLLFGSLLLGLIAFVIFGIGVLAQQGRAVQRELWRLRGALGSLGRSDHDSRW
jgi:hypothetical protein